MASRPLDKDDAAKFRAVFKPVGARPAARRLKAMGIPLSYETVRKVLDETPDRPFSADTRRLIGDAVRRAGQQFAASADFVRDLDGVFAWLGRRHEFDVYNAKPGGLRGLDKGSRDIFTSELPPSRAPDEAL